MAGEINVYTEVLEPLLPTLHATSDATLTHWIAFDLLQYADEGIKRLARIAAVFVERDQTLVTAAGAKTYALPARHISTLHASLTSRSLRPAVAIELEALDQNYRTTPASAGNPVAYWYEDQLGEATIALAPIPAAAEAIALVQNAAPPDLSASGNLLQAPPPLKGYLAMTILLRAYSQEGESEMPDISKHAEARIDLYHQLFLNYYGAGT